MRRHYIISDDQNKNHSIQVIPFRKKRYDEAYKSIAKWTKLIKTDFLDSLIDWEELLTTKTPTQLKEDCPGRLEELRLLCHLPHHYQILTRNAKNVEWLLWANEVGLLSKVFEFGANQLDDKTYKLTGVAPAKPDHLAGQFALTDKLSR